MRFNILQITIMLRITLLVLMGALVGIVHSDCYRNWSRCTPQTMVGTGIFWKSCPDYCQQCHGRKSGACVRVNSGACSGGFQCQCSGGNIPKSTDTWTMNTCRFGL